MRAIVALVALILVSPPSGLSADERGWQGWAFEVRADHRYGWLGGWTPAGCETLRHAAIAERMGESIGPCFSVTLVAEPTAGIEVWVLADDTAFAMAPSPELCEEEPLRPLVRPVALTAAGCPRMWFRVAA